LIGNVSSYHLREDQPAKRRNEKTHKDTDNFVTVGY
jgi:hypothetical protein